MAIWKKLYDSGYSISDNGEVRKDSTGLLLKPIVSNDLPNRVRLVIDGKVYTKQIDRLVFELFAFEPRGYKLEHIDGNIHNDSLINLEPTLYSRKQYKIKLRDKTFIDDENIVWKEIPEYNNYSVSNDGRIKNNLTGYILIPTNTLDGRKRVTLYNKVGSKHFYVHKLVYTVFNENDESSKFIFHKDGDPDNNSVSNLIGSVHPAGGFRIARLNRKKRIRIIETGDIYKNLTECALAIGGTKQGVSMCIGGATKTYKGFTFEYID